MAQAFVCGPTPLVETAAGSLVDIGLAAEPGHEPSASDRAEHEAP